MSIQSEFSDTVKEIAARENAVKRVAYRRWLRKMHADYGTELPDDFYTGRDLYELKGLVEELGGDPEEVVELFNPAEPVDDGFYKPPVALNLKGAEGNTLAIAASCVRAGRRAGWKQEVTDNIVNEMLSGDRVHVMDILFEFFEPVAEVIQHRGLDRSEAE